MTISQWVGLVSDYTAVPVAIIGFGIAFYQIYKTKRAAEAARDASRTAERILGKNQLIALIHQLQRIEDEITRAVQSGAPESVISWLGFWRWQANQVRGLVNQSADNHQKASRLIQASVAKAAEACSLLTEDPDAELTEVTKSSRAAIYKVTNEVGALVAVHSSTVDAGGES